MEVLANGEGKFVFFFFAHENAEGIVENVTSFLEYNIFSSLDQIPGETERFRLNSFQ